MSKAQVKNQEERRNDSLNPVADPCSTGTAASKLHVRRAQEEILQRASQRRSLEPSQMSGIAANGVSGFGFGGACFHYLCFGRRVIS